MVSDLGFPAVWRPESCPPPQGGGALVAFALWHFVWMSGKARRAEVSAVHSARGQGQLPLPLLLLKVKKRQFCLVAWAEPEVGRQLGSALLPWATPAEPAGATGR